MPKSMNVVKRWLLQDNAPSPRAPRVMKPEILVHYWDGAAPDGRRLRDISETGAYILTTERWYSGTIIRIVLQGRRSSAQNGSSAVSPEVPAASICVPAQVVRQGDDGVAVTFIFSNKRERQNFRDFLATMRHQPSAASAEQTAGASAEKAAAASAVRTEGRAGQALVEFALIAPLVFLLAVNAVNFGGFIFAWITLAGATRDGAEYMIMSSASPGSPSAPTSGQITTLVTSDVTSLLNRASITVSTCTNGTAAANGCTALFDPEAPSYTLATLDVTYTYQPFIPLFSFPKLGISATLPSTTIHRKAVMRMLQ
jgi:Flp pilus assembly protein TadG